jgi:hypothetical protein
MRVAKDGIEARIQLRVHKNCCRSAPVVGAGRSSKPCARRGSNHTPALDIRRPHHRTSVANRTHLQGYSLRLCSLHRRKKSLKNPSSVGTDLACSRRSSSQARICWTNGFSTPWRAACRCNTAFHVPCSSLLGEKTPSGVIKDWHSCDSEANSSSQYPWLKSNVAKSVEPCRRESFDSMCGIGHARGTVCLFTGRRSTVKRNFAGPGFGTSSAAEHQKRELIEEQKAQKIAEDRLANTELLVDFLRGGGTAPDTSGVKRPREGSPG